ncbi:MAG: hypothetical protein DWQ34_27000 [Planctomycetota bacterium]|nr:MAG: hypothetical protein DWQ34_27000 [Planctomycetota bacterium]REK28458.1 MAG: hypothetical protein DWQ41_05770 [Planctomycetota bacterium]REK29123.1 MAG: hypothetical protein DWQ45_23565 [Planctomycetota bacterium]
MVGQASINGKRTGARQVSRNLSGLAHDVITLAELQAQLVACDLREGKAQAIGPIVVIVAGLLLALGTMPVLLLGLGWLLVNHAEWTESAAFLTAGGAGLAVAGLLAWFGWKKLKAALSTFTRSQQEFARNVDWVKSALKWGARR